MRRTLRRTGRVLHSAHRRKSLFPDSLAKERTLELGPLLVGKHNSSGGVPGAEEILALWVGLRFEAGATPGVGLARQQELAEPLGSAECIDGFQQLQKRRGTSLGGAVDGGVMPGGEYRELAILIGDPQSITQVDDEWHTRFLVTMVTRPPCRRRECLPEIVRKRRETHHIRRADLSPHSAPPT